MAICAVLAAAAAQGAPANLTAAGGVYSAEQAARGEQAYAAHCAVCHGGDLSGIDPAPALAGDGFVQAWSGQSLADLHKVISATMPKQQPHSLSDASYADVLAFILQANGYAPGDKALPADEAGLAAIRIGAP